MHEEDVGVREGRLVQQALKMAGRPYHKTLDGFALNGIQLVSKSLLQYGLTPCTT